MQVPLHYGDFEGLYESEIIQEFISAEKYLKKQDYNKCVAHCRSCLDVLNRNLRKVKAKEESESKFKWIEKVSAEAFAYLDALSKYTSSVSSITHHAGS